MSAVGFRCILEPRKSPTEPIKVKYHYFALTSQGEIEGDGGAGLNDVLTALKHDEIKNLVQKSFKQLQKLLEAAALKGHDALVTDFKLQLELFRGWEISVKGFADEELGFNSVAEFQTYLISAYKIEPLPEVNEVDALVATIPGL